MKERRFLRNLLVTLLVLVLSVTFTYSDFTVVKADIIPVEKELMQCSDNWVIFRYMDEDNNPQFEVTYDGKTVDELNENERLEYKLILKGKDYTYVTSSRTIFHGNITIDSSFEEYPKEDIYVQFILVKSDKRILSDCLPLSNSSPCILSVSTGYLNTYSIADGEPNKFLFSMKVNEHLKQVGGLSVSIWNTDNLNNVASNISFKNFSENYSIDGENYTLNYSIVTFDLELADKLFYNPEIDDSMTKAIVIDIFSFTGLVGIQSNKNIENLQFYAMTPAFPESEKTVVDPEPTKTLVKSIKISGSTSVTAGKTINLSYSVNSDATNKNVTWSSSNTNYATVDKNGKVTTKLAGAGKTVTITAKANDGSGKLATFKLNIAKIPVTKIKLKAKKSVKAGKKLTIKATINPTNATDKKVTWSVNKKKYAKINSKGVLTAKKAGKGKTVTVTAKAGEKKATIKIKIKK